MSSYAYFDSPAGRLLLAGDERGLSLISFPSGSRAQAPKSEWRHEARIFSRAFRELDEYFAGTRTAFSLPLQVGGSAFQNAVWTALQAIPYGQTRSYRELAARIGRPAASRAVGAANGANPLPIVIPCHRLIGSDGSLTGFGGGLETKRFLLAHEQRNALAPSGIAVA